MKIKVTSPCSENWDVMKPENNSRFCDSCEKSVMDFTKMEKEDIIRFMLRNKNNNICGRMDNGLMKFTHDELMSVIDKELITNKRTNYGFYLMLLGTLSILGCSNNTENNTQNLTQDSKTTLVIADTAKTQNINDSDSINKVNNKLHSHKIEHKNSALQNELNDKGIKTSKGDITCELPSKEVMINPPVGGVALIQENYNNPNAVFANVEIQPMFEGGLDELGRFLTKTLKYPKYEKENKIEGRVFVSFIVEKDGRITNPLIVRTPSNSFGEEVLRIMGLMPKWKPGIQKGQAVRVSYVLPVIFQLNKSN